MPLYRTAPSEAAREGGREGGEEWSNRQGKGRGASAQLRCTPAPGNTSRVRNREETTPRVRTQDRSRVAHGVGVAERNADASAN